MIMLLLSRKPFKYIQERVFFLEDVIKILLRLSFVCTRLSVLRRLRT